MHGLTINLLAGWALGMPLAAYLAITKGRGAVGCWQAMAVTSA